MPFQENPTITATEDVSAALSAIRECIVFLTTRNRDTFCDSDFDELQRILDACDRIQDYHLIVRAGMSKRYHEDMKKSAGG